MKFNKFIILTYKNSSNKNLIKKKGIRRSVKSKNFPKSTFKITAQSFCLSLIVVVVIGSPTNSPKSSRHYK